MSRRQKGLALTEGPFCVRTGRSIHLTLDSTQGGEVLTPEGEHKSPRLSTEEGYKFVLERSV